MPIRNQKKQDRPADVLGYFSDFFSGEGDKTGAKTDIWA
jgi:hypothetical protein